MKIHLVSDTGGLKAIESDWRAHIGSLEREDDVAADIARAAGDQDGFGISH